VEVTKFVNIASLLLLANAHIPDFRSQLTSSKSS
jgi:hypothetical protein